MQLYLIRHGHTVGDVEDRYGGDYDDALSPEGEQQVKQLVQELAGSGIKVVYSSPLLRARQTAGHLAEALKCPVVIVPGLKERNQYGPLTGLTKGEARQKYPELVEQVKNRLNTLPGAESYAESSRRMSAAFEEVVGHNNTCAAVVWHGGGMRVLFRDILEEGELKEIGDCSWVRLERDARHSPFQISAKERLVFDFTN